MTARTLTPTEREAIAARYGATCTIAAVTVCPPCTHSPPGRVAERWQKRDAKARGKGLKQMNGAKEFGMVPDT